MTNNVIFLEKVIMIQMKEIIEIIVNNETIKIGGTYYFIQKVIMTFLGFIVGAYWKKNTKNVNYDNN